MLKHRGIVFVISGPSGAGKSTVARKMIDSDGNLKFSVSCTTRLPRNHEAEGGDYYFIAKDQFQRHIAQNDFLEYAEVHGNWYGTLKVEVENRLSAGNDVLLDIDVQGAVSLQRVAKQDHRHIPYCFIFIGPPSIRVLEDRLRTRATDSDATIKKRMEKAKFELNQWRNYDYIVINREISETIAGIKAIVGAERSRTTVIVGDNLWDPAPSTG